MFCCIWLFFEDESVFDDFNFVIDCKGEFVGRRFEITFSDALKKYDFMFDCVFVKKDS